MAYVADENGYRVTKMISEVRLLLAEVCKMVSIFFSQPIGNGPVMNKKGQAIVQMLVSGVETEYAIQAQPIEEIEEKQDKKEEILL